MNQSILIIFLIIYSVSITGLFFVLRKMFNDYIRSTNTKINQTDILKTKYDWSKAPEWVNWIATNEGGYAFGHVEKPVTGRFNEGFWWLGGQSVFLLWPSENPFKDDWQDSLEQRPVGSSNE